MATKYPHIRFENYGGYISAIIHLSESETTLALPSRSSLAIKMKQLVDERKISRFNFVEFIKLALIEKMIDEIGTEEDDDPIAEMLREYMGEVILKKAMDNPYSEKPCIRKKKLEDGTIAWFLSSQNSHSYPFKTKSDGEGEILDLLAEKDSRDEEIEEMYKLLNISKEIPGELRSSQKGKVN